MVNKKFQEAIELGRRETLRNIKRVSSISKSKKTFEMKCDNGTPMFTRLEFSLTDLCNRKCDFCPRFDPKVYPNNNEEMRQELYTKIIMELSEIGWAGGIVFSGYGEPMLHSNIYEFCRITKQALPETTIDLITNGDILNEKRALKLYDSGIDMIKISLYDSVDQIDKFKEMMKRIGISENNYMLRPRFINENIDESDLTIILSQRAGMVNAKRFKKDEEGLPLKESCCYPFYKFLIDYDGRAYMCSHDWTKTSPIGDLREQSLIEVWTGEEIGNARKNLYNKNRGFGMPCKKCNINGRLSGREESQRWNNIYNKEQ